MVAERIQEQDKFFRLDIFDYQRRHCGTSGN